MAVKAKAKAKAKVKPSIFTFLRSAMRSASRRWPAIYEALAAAKEPYHGPNLRQKVQYRCAACRCAFSSKQVAIDHIVDCGTLKDWGDVEGFMRRLFCEKEGLQVLCHDCHDAKTHQAKVGGTIEEAKLAKKAIEFCKQSPEVVIKYLLQLGHSKAEVSNQVKRRALVERHFKEKL